ncbi:MAG: FHA domain-containing protein [Oligoflexia bacterium]|nr:FHA domain-containing protein [Oligoflexia bacterium]MBF0364369.1 FHA domain-containing protein [Oligoflexia bacterium]
MLANKVIIRNNFDQPQNEGLHHRLLCLSGAKKGESYFLIGERIIIGRSEKAEIQLNDNNISREHVELIKLGNDYVVTDLKSQNGIILNDLKITQEILKDGDRLVVGQTVFKYNKINITVDSLKKSKINSINSSDKNQHTENNSTTIETNSKAETPIPNPAKNKKKIMLYGVIFLAILSFSLVDEKPKNASNSGTTESSRIIKKGGDISSEINRIIQKKKNKEDKEVEANLNIIFLRGLRETREKNYFRAINEFNLALILSPENARARHYLDIVTKRLDEEVNEYFINGSRYHDSLRYEAAAMEYCRILRLLQNFPEDQRYKDALSNVKELEIKLGKEPGEIKCISR